MSAHHHDHDHDQRPDDSLPDILDLDAEVLADALREVYREIEDRADTPVRTILDLGAGTGAGTLGLLRHFDGAHATAVDADGDMLDHLRRRAAELGLTDRVTTVQADLDRGVPTVEPVDLAWASASMHHLADPGRVLRELIAVIRPGGLLAVVELPGFPRFVANDAVGGAAESRAHALLAVDRAVDLPTMGDREGWARRLDEAGLDVEIERTLQIDLAPPLPAATGRYAGAILTRVRSAVAERMDAADLASFDLLVDGGTHDVRRRDDLRVSTTRWLWIARRLVK